ncbi:MAG TPA: methyltransferase domain-containing protein [Chthoniobacterales bacterium]|nr:methyltransferase domain-containing protein [Chthoniobacterales bacterium]
MNDDSASPDFWSSRYVAGRMPWDLQGVPPALEEFLRQTPSRGHVLIPGCGSGYEVRAFHEAGFQVTAIDFSSGAIQRARDVLGSLAEKVRLGDFFVYDFADRPFDLIYERTFLSSLAPSRWPDYARRMAELLKPRGKLVGIFIYGHEPDPPPFPLSEEPARKMFANAFRLTRNELLPNSLPVFAGMEERWQEWTRLA